MRLKPYRCGDMDTTGIDANFTRFYGLWKDGRLGDAAVASLFFLWGQARKSPGASLASRFARFEPESNDAILLFLRRHQYKRVRGKVLIALENWLAARWPLVLTEKVPTPLDVLRLQAGGRRPVSMIVREEALAAPVEHKENAFAFLIHDLEHAYMFFHDESLCRQQADFFASVLRSWEEGLWQEFMSEAVFARGFHYMMSDMNAHPQHGRQYLRALLIDFYRRKRNLGPSEKLAGHDQGEIDDLVGAVL